MRLSRVTAALVGALAILLAATACGASSGHSEADPQMGDTSEAAVTCDARSIPSAEAGQHIGEEATVCGLVKDYYRQNTGDKPTLLLFEQTGSGRIGFAGTKTALFVPFAVFIVWKDKDNFPANFGSFYSGKTVCATGVIERLPQGFGRFREDNPVIVARTSSQLDVDCKAQ